MDYPGKTGRVISSGKKWLAICIALLFILSLNTAVLGYIGQNILSDQDTYRTIINKTDSINQIRSILMENVVQKKMGISSDEWGVDQAALSSFAQLIFPDDWLWQLLDQEVQDLVEFIKSPEMDLLEYDVDLHPVIAVLRSPQGASAVMSLWGSLPLCKTQQQIEELLSGQITCAPPEQLLPVASKTASLYIAEQIPEQITRDELSSMGTDLNSIDESLILLRQVYRSLRDIFLSALISAIFFMMLYLLIFINKPKYLLSALPWPLYGALALGLCLRLLSGFLVSYMINMPAIPNVNISFEPEAIMPMALTALFDIIKQQWTILLLALAGITVLIHLFTLIIILVFRKSYAEN